MKQLYVWEAREPYKIANLLQELCKPQRSTVNLLCDQRNVEFDSILHRPQRHTESFGNLLD